MDLGIAGKKALVGGASKGLGLAAAQALAAEGCEVALVSRSRGNLEKAQATFGPNARVLLVEADLGTDEGIGHCQRAVKDWGPIDILVNNTGGPPPGGTFAHDEDTWRSAYETLLLYVKRMCEYAVPGMRERGWGRLITITSRTVKEPAGQLVLSNVFRTAVTAYLKVLADEVAADGITVNTVLPGAFRTERYEQLIEATSKARGTSREEVVAQMLQALPQRRFQRVEELGSLVAFLASEPASGITGAALPVDGGALRGLLG